MIYSNNCYVAKVFDRHVSNVVNKKIFVLLFLYFYFFWYLNNHQFYMPCYNRSHTYWDSTYNHLYKNSSHLILYTNNDIHHDSIFALNYIYLHLIFIQFNPHLQDSCWNNSVFSFNPDFKLNTFTFIFFISSGPHNQAYGSSTY